MLLKMIRNYIWEVLFNYLLLSGIPTYLKEEDVRKICEAFGVVKFLNLVTEG